MAVGKRTRKKLVNLAYLFAVSLIFVWAGVGEYWNGRLPTIPDESTGRIYAIHFHGTDGYVHAPEITIFYALPITALVLAIIINRIDQYLDRKNKNNIVG